MSDAHHHHDFASANQAFFDKHAHQADHRPKAAELAESVCKAVLEAYPFNKESTTVLDYACGTGIVARGLAPHCKSLLGVDISQGMVDEFNKGIQNHGIPIEQMRAVRADLKGEESELEGIRFDVVVCSLAYHHIVDVAAVTRTLAFFLKPGGSLIVVDFPTMDVAAVPQEVVHSIAHKGGISESAIKEAYDSAGLGDFHQVLFKGPETPMHPEDIFLAKGVKL
ncbi:S-adenosyl-L-methionine-dependent methyltransferase [Mycena alexandri]|uniref:S-adenosyl-L-methionine-dependent methyltransferase n=1 Tax=Mycena alexandri TaxID=1745969 RepID=A0AAD6TB23_9AGAR|nr:S-adenosyl-L-methionine-dependent methyltransferase [Mycena alexandri]